MDVLKVKGKLSKKMLLNEKREKCGSGLALIGLQTTGTWVKIYPWVSANLLSNNWDL